MKFKDLIQNFITDYRINNKKSLKRAMQSIAHLQGFFGRKRLITTNLVSMYILQRQREGAKNATINRELSALKRMFTLASRMPLPIPSIPYIPFLKENNIREGYFEYEEYLAIKNALPFYLRPLITIAYYTGMRKEEILSLQWSQIDLIEGRIILKSENTKNSKPRIIYIQGEALEEMRSQKEIRDNKYPGCPYVFFGKNGEKIKNFRSAWKTACKKTGLEGRIFHDFRRTAIRNMVRAGVPERIVMMVSGHKTRSVFERYNIVNEDDLKKVANKLLEYHKKPNKVKAQEVCGGGTQYE